MLTHGFKLFFGFTAIAVVAAIIYGVASGDTTAGNYLGVVDRQAWKGAISLGWQGGVGDHTGYVILWLLAISGGVVALVLAYCRDADPDAVAEVMQTDGVPPAQAPTRPDAWPLIGALAVGVTIIGLVTHAAIFVIGVILLGVVALELILSTWADRATGDPATNAEIRGRVARPIEVPVLGAAAIAVVVLGGSQVMLAVSKAAAVWVLTGVATVVFVGAIALAAMPKLSRPIIGGAVALIVVASVVGGIVGAVVGIRDIEEHHDEEHSEEIEEDAAAVGVADLVGTVEDES
ncbi:MAG: hypothetical protein RIE08_02830 [Acidimicrobiales bacterium]